MSADAIYPIPTQVGADGVHHAQTVFTPEDDKKYPRCTVPPWTVVPVIFVPGIMGSNLKAKVKIRLPAGGLIKAGVRVWNVDGLTSPMSMWGKGPAYRQAAFDKDALEVDNGGLINVSRVGYENKVVGGKATRVAVGETRYSRIHIDEARKRGWGSASWKYYGEFLDALQYQLSDGRLVGGKPNGAFKAMMNLVGTAPDSEHICPVPLTEAQVRKMLDIHFPVYAVGYNWLQSNMDSGRDLVDGAGGNGPGHVMGINEIIKRYDGVNGQTCKQVIVLTHSMGGLVARAAALAHNGEGKMLGIIHGVQPIDGAAAFYKRIAAGFEGEGSGIGGSIAGWVTSKVLGPDSRYTIPELAYNPGPLELAPNKRYNGGKPWLFIKDRQGKVLKALPEHGDPYTEIYLDTTHVWRAVNPEWLNPAGLPGNPFDFFVKAVAKAHKYHAQLGGKLHPKTYAHWGADASRKSWGKMTWTAETGTTYTPSSWDMAMSQGMARSQWLPDWQHAPTRPEQWSFQTPVTAAGTQRDLLSAQKKEIHMTVDDPSDAGDGTVPAAASGAQIANYAGCQIACALTGFDHQDDYNNAGVRKVLLDAVVRLVEPVVVTD